MAIAEISERRCSRCGETKPLAEYYIYKSRKDQRFSRCKVCQRELSSARYYRALAEDPLHLRKLTLRNRYSMTLEDYDAMLKGQGGTCLCGRLPESCLPHGVLHVDHDHSCCPGEKACGKCNRGLLCPSCNRILAISMDNAALLRELADYLDR